MRDVYRDLYDINVISYISITYFDMFCEYHEVFFEGTKLIETLPSALFKPSDIKSHSSFSVDTYPMDIHRVSWGDIAQRISNIDYIKLPRFPGQ